MVLWRDIETNLTMLKQSKASEPSILAPLVVEPAARAGATENGVKRLSGDLPRGRAPKATTALEVELKLVVAAEQLGILKNHPLFRNRKSKKDEIVSIYLDTRDHVLRRHGLSFRVRRKGDELLQTIKGPYSGIIDRGEREIPLTREKKGQPGAIDAFLHHLDRNVPTALKPVFKTRIERETYQIGGIEVCLDKGEIIAGRRSSPVVEVELELKRGDRKELFALARQICSIVPAELSSKSKSERGYDLLEGARTRAVTAQDPALSGGSTVTEALKIVCGECLRQLTGNRAGVKAGMAEALHQARVALRRLDAAARLFRKIQDRTAAKIAGELKWIGDELADARELDVFMTDFLAPLRREHPTEASLAKVHDSCVQLRKKAYEKANAALGSLRFRTFLVDVAEWIETGAAEKARSPTTGEAAARDMASRSLSKMLRKTKSDQRIEDLDLRSLHKLRLRAKRMRYTIEFTGSLYDEHPSRMEPMLKQLGKMQSALGKLTDMAQARTMLSRIAGKAKVARVIGDRRWRKSEQLKKAARAFEKFGNLKPFWI